MIAGIDFYIPEDLTVDYFNSKNADNIDTTTDGTYLKSFTVYPDNMVTIPSGIKLSVPKDYAMIFFNKSGVATKKRMEMLACVVDEGYQGEIIITMVNVGYEPQTFFAGDKITQGIFVPMTYFVPNEVKTEEECFTEKSSRGEGGFGSTDEKKH